MWCNIWLMYHASLQEKIENASGHGVIVADYLKSSLNYAEYVKQELENGKTFHGYNFVAIELRYDYIQKQLLLICLVSIWNKSKLFINA